MCLCVLQIINLHRISDSSESWVIIGLLGGLPVIALVLIWILFFYCICKNERRYRKTCKVHPIATIVSVALYMHAEALGDHHILHYWLFIYVRN